MQSSPFADLLSSNLHGTVLALLPIDLHPLLIHHWSPYSRVLPALKPGLAYSLFREISSNGKRGDQLLWPLGTAQNPASGNLFCLDAYYPSAIKEFQPDGTYVQTLSHELLGIRPKNLLFDCFGNLALLGIPDEEYKLYIQIMTPRGNPISKFQVPVDLPNKVYPSAKPVWTLDNQGNFVVAIDQQVAVLQQTGECVLSFAGDFSQPGGIAVDQEGHFYVGGHAPTAKPGATAQSIIQKYDSAGKLLTTIGKWEKSFLSGVTIDRNGTLLVLRGNIGIMVYSKDGELIKKKLLTQVAGCNDLKIGPQGQLIVTRMAGDTPITIWK